MRLFFSTLCLLCLCSTASMAQQGNAQATATGDLPARTETTPLPSDDSSEITMLRGKVIDLNGNPLPGATLMVEGTDWITVTNSKGEYALPIKGAASAAKVKCSYQGMADRAVAIPFHSGELTIRMDGGAKMATPTSKGKPRDL